MRFVFWKLQRVREAAKAASRTGIIPGSGGAGPGDYGEIDIHED